MPPNVTGFRKPDADTGNDMSQRPKAENRAQGRMSHSTWSGRAVTKSMNNKLDRYT